MYTYELDIFRAICRWIKSNQDEEDPEAKIKVLSAVRYPLMALEELLSVVRESQLVSSDNILDAIQLRNTLPSHKLKFRGQLSMYRISEFNFKPFFFIENYTQMIELTNNVCYIV